MANPYKNIPYPAGCCLREGDIGAGASSASQRFFWYLFSSIGKKVHNKN
jgi:hypothetical protein